MELTKEYFEEHLNRTLNVRFTQQEAKFDAKLEAKLDTKLGEQTKELKAFVVKHTAEQTEALARMVNKGFEHVNTELKIIINRLDVREKIEEFDRKFDKLENALNIKL